MHFNRPFNEQLAFFKQKLNLPSERWDSIERAANDKGFIVAGAQGADLLNDLNRAVTRAIEQGTGLEAFRKDFRAIVAKNGWTGWTGEGSPEGIAWRTKVIYQTNMASSYAAGRWKQLNDHELLKVLPYWKYNHSDSVITPRPLHVSWDGLILPPDHPFWKTHYPLNGWGCHCWVSAVSKSDFLQAIAAGRGPANAPTGTEGIDEGFDYAPGAGTDASLRQLVQDKLITYPPAISRALSKDINRYVNVTEPAADYAVRVLEDRSKTDPLWLGFVENPTAVSAVAGRDVTGYLVLLPDEAPRHADNAHGHDGGDQRPPTPQDFALVWKILAEADSLRPGDVSATGLATVVAVKVIGGEIYRCVFDVRPGKKNRALALLSMIIKR